MPRSTYDLKSKENMGNANSGDKDGTEAGNLAHENRWMNEINWNKTKRKVARYKERDKLICSVLVLPVAQSTLP